MPIKRSPLYPPISSFVQVISKGRGVETRLDLELSEVSADNPLEQFPYGATGACRGLFFHP